jgi:hypothetical protein
MQSRSSSAEASPRVQIPGAGADRPSWARVGVIAAIGFVVGVAWPRLAGVRLGPSVPESAASASASASPTSAPSSPVSPTPVPATASDAPGAVPPAARPVRPAQVPVTTAVPATAPEAEPPPGAPAVSVGRGAVTACKTAQGDSLKGGDCGTLAGFDALVVPRLRRLAECPAAVGAAGKARVLVRADFGRGAVSADLGRGAALPNAEGLLACARTELRGVSLGSIAHENARYTVGYSVTFGAVDSSAAAPVAAAVTVAEPASASDGVAQVAWEVAVVRDAPKTGKVVAKLQRGTTLHAGTPNDGWIPVKYGDNFARDGWVYHGAIGR